MNKTQLNELNMYTNLKDFFQANIAAWIGNREIGGVVEAMNYHLDVLINYNTVPTKIQIESSERDLKLKAHVNMVTAAMHLTNMGKEYARAAGNKQLFFELNSIKNKIVLSENTDSSLICQKIHNLISPCSFNTSHQKITATSLSNLQHLINTYNSLTYCPNFEQKIRAKTPPGIVSHFRALNLLLKKQLDVLMSPLRNENPLFYNQYKTVRVINNIGQRLTATLQGYVYDRNYRILSNTVVDLTNEQGLHKIVSIDKIYRFTRLQPGEYVLTVSAIGFITQVKPIVIDKNNTLHIDFILDAYPLEDSRGLQISDFKFAAKKIIMKA